MFVFFLSSYLSAWPSGCEQLHLKYIQIFLTFCMWLQINKSQSPYLLKNRLKVELFRFFEKLCHQNLLAMILHESSCNFSFLIVNLTHIYLGKFLILIYHPKISLINQIFQTPILTYSSTDNFSSPISVFYWLIFCCGNSILHQIRNKNDKNTKFLIKATKKCEESILNIQNHFLLRTRPTDP